MDKETKYEDFYIIGEAAKCDGGLQAIHVWHWENYDPHTDPDPIDSALRNAGAVIFDYGPYYNLSDASDALREIEGGLS